MGKPSAGLWGTSSRLWLGCSDTSSPKIKHCDYPGMELNFILMFHILWLYQERVPTSNKEKKRKTGKNGRKRPKRQANEPNVTYYTTLLLLHLVEKCFNQI